MGGDDSQKLLPWRGILSPPGRKPPAQLRIQHCSGKLRGWGTCRHHLPRTTPGPVVAQLRTWVIFGKQTWVISPARRRSFLSSGIGDIIMAKKMPSSRRRKELSCAEFLSNHADELSAVNWLYEMGGPTTLAAAAKRPQ